MTRSGKRFPFVEIDSLKRVAIVCHRNADVDAYLSAYALSRLLRKISPRAEVDIVAPEKMTVLAKRLSRAFPHRLVEQSDATYDLFIAVDVGHTELLRSWLGKMTESKAVKVLVDHHPMQRSSIYDRAIVDTSATSAAEVVYRVFKDLGVSIDRKAAQALMVAILFDSQHLGIAGVGALRATIDLIDHGAKLEEARRMLRSQPDYGEVIARLKGAQRLQILHVGSWVVATSRVGSFQAAVARGLINLGADVAIVTGEVGGETRSSLRSTPRFFDVRGIHLGTGVAEVVAKEGGGYGGGHPTAASMSCRLGEDDVESRCIATISELLKAEPVRLT